MHPDQPGQLAGYPLPGPAQRQPDLGAGARSGRQLQVPAGVIAAPAAPQRDSGPDQPQVGGVEIVSLELLLARPGGPRNLRQLIQLRQDGPAGASYLVSVSLAVTVMPSCYPQRAAQPSWPESQCRYSPGPHSMSAGRDPV